MNSALEALGRWSQVCLPVLLDAAAKGAVLLVLAGLVIQAMRRSSAAVRQMVWVVALAAILAVPLVSGFVPAWHVLPGWATFEMPAPKPLLLSHERETAVPPGHAAIADKDLGAASPWPGRIENAPSALPRETVEGPIAAPVAPTPAPEAPKPKQARWVGVVSWAPAAWLGGVLLCLAPLVLGRLSLWRLARKSRRLDSGPLADLAGRAAEAVGLRRAVVLLLSEAESMPLVWGILRPRLLLPAEAETWPAERRWVVLLHELGHARRHDCLAKLIAHVACAAHWFNPLAWLAFRWMQRDAEAACDDLVLASGHQPSDYATHLLEIASGLKSGMLAAYSSIAMARRSKLEGRLLAILDGRRNRRRLTRTVLILVLAAAGCVVPTLAAMRASARAADAEFVSAKVVRWQIVGGQDKDETIVVTDAEKIARLASFFPGLGRGRAPLWPAGWDSRVIVTFTRNDGTTLQIASDCDRWSSPGKGDWPVRGDLKGFIGGLFPGPATQPVRVLKTLSPVAQKLAAGLPAGWRLQSCGRCDAPRRWSGKTDCECLTFVHETLKFFGDGLGPAGFTVWLTPPDYKGRPFPSEGEQPGGAYLAYSRPDRLAFIEALPPEQHAWQVVQEVFTDLLGFKAVSDGTVAPPTTQPDAAAAQAKRITGLIERLAGETLDERENAQMELLKIGLPALPALREAAKGDSPERVFRVKTVTAELWARLEKTAEQAWSKEAALRRPAAQWLQSGLPVLILAVKERWPQEALALAALWALGPPAKDAVPVLIAALGYKPSMYLMPPYAKMALARIGEPAVPALTAVLRDRTTTVKLRMEAVSTLRYIGHSVPGVVPALAEAAEDKNNLVRRMALTALTYGEAARPALPAILKAETDSDPVVRRYATALLKKLGLTWSEPVKGLRMRVRLEDGRFEPDKPTVFLIEFQNVSDKPLRILKDPKRRRDLNRTLLDTDGHGIPEPIITDVLLLRMPIPPEMTIVLAPGAKHRITYRERLTDPRIVRLWFSYRPVRPLRDDNPELKGYWHATLGEGLLRAECALRRPDAPVVPEDAIVWEGEVHLDKKVVVPVGKTLAIKPGTKVNISGYWGTYLDVRGTLIAVGTKDRPIEFLVAKRGYWGGIRFIGSKAGGTLEHCLIQNGRHAGVLCEGGSPTIRNCRIVYDTSLTGNGIVCEGGAAPLVEGNLIRSEKGPVTLGGILIVDGKPTIRGNTFTNYMIGVQAARSEKAKPVVGPNMLEGGSLTVLREGTATPLTFSRVLDSDDIKFVTSMRVQRTGKRAAIEIHTWTGTYRVRFASGRYVLEQTADEPNPDKAEHGATKGLVARAQVELGTVGTPVVFSMPTVLSQLGRAGCSDTPEDILIVYDTTGTGAEVKWISEAPKRGKFYVVAADLDGDGTEEIIAAMNGWCDQMGRIKVYTLGKAGAAVPPAAPDDVPSLIAQLTDDTPITSGPNRGKTHSEVGREALLAKGQAAVRPLIETLKTPDVMLRSRAESILLAMKGPHALDGLLGALSDTDASLRKAVVTTLQRFTESRAVTGLFTALKDDDEGVRSTAAELLKRTTGPHSVQPIVAALKDADARVRTLAAGLLGDRAEQQAVGALAAAVADEDPQVRLAVVKALGVIRDPVSTEALAAALRDEVGDVCYEAAFALGQRQDGRALPLLVAALNDGNWYRAIQGLRWIGDPRTVQPLIDALRHPNPGARRAAAEALGQKADARAAQALVAALADQDERVRQAAALGLARQGDIAVPPLGATLKQIDVETRRLVIRAIGEGASRGRAAGPPFVGFLATVLRDPDLEVRREAAGALGRIRSPRGVEPLTSALKDPALGIGPEAAAALGQIGDWRAITPLLAGLKSPDARQRQAAAVALGGIRGDPTAVAPLIAALDDNDRDVRDAAAGALRDITGERFGDEPDRWRTWWNEVQHPTEPVKVLVGRLSDPSADVRRRAIWALGHSDDPAALNAVFEHFYNRKDGKAVYADDRMHSQDVDYLQAAVIQMGEWPIERLIPVADAGWAQIEDRAIEVLLRVGEAAKGPLIEALLSPTWKARVGAAKVEARLKHPEAVIPLVKACERFNHDIFEALMAFGAEADPALRHAVNDPAFNVASQTAAALLLVHHGDLTGWPLLERTVSEGSGQEMNQTASRMYNLADPVFLPLIEKALGRKEAEQTVTYAAARCGGTAAISMLRKALAHPNRGVRSGAADWIKRLEEQRR